MALTFCFLIFILVGKTDLFIPPNHLQPCGLVNSFCKSENFLNQTPGSSHCAYYRQIVGY